MLKTFSRAEKLAYMTREKKTNVFISKNCSRGHSKTTFVEEGRGWSP